MDIIGDDNNILIGTLEDDFIFGLGGDDSLDADDGNDTLDGGNGNDQLVERCYALTIPSTRIPY